MKRLYINHKEITLHSKVTPQPLLRYHYLVLCMLHLIVLSQ
jgi:hypothetical protein